MIRTESEYKEAVQHIMEEEERLRQREAQLADDGLTKEEIKEVLDPMWSFHLQFVDDVRAYERHRRGEIGEFEGLSGIGHLLVAARIASGLTQRELAERLGVDESQVSRDERNEYHGVTLGCTQRVLAALNVQTRTTVELLKLENCHDTG